MSNLHTKYHFKLDFQKVDQHTGGKCLIQAPNAAVAKPGTPLYGFVGVSIEIHKESL